MNKFHESQLLVLRFCTLNFYKITCLHTNLMGVHETHQSESNWWQQRCRNPCLDFIIFHTCWAAKSSRSLIKFHKNSIVPVSTWNYDKTWSLSSSLSLSRGSTRRWQSLIVLEAFERSLWSEVKLTNSLSVHPWRLTPSFQAITRVDKLLKV